MSLTVAITGHRRLPPGAGIVVRETIAMLVARYPGATWRAGGAIGTDQIATDVLLGLGQIVHLILPFPLEIQAARWTPIQIRQLHDQIARASHVEVLSQRYHVSGYHQRNLRLLERADVLVAFTDGRSAGGTASVIRQAKRGGIPVIRGKV